MKKIKRRTLLLILLELLLLAVFLFSGVKIWQHFKAERENRVLYTELTEVKEETKNQLEEAPSAQTVTPAELYAPFEERNADFAAWLTIEGTQVDYPVMQSEEKDYYLYRDFEKKYSVYGALYLTQGCDPDRSQNLLIHGHHMKNGSMFAVLTKYTSKKFYEAHKTLTFDTLESFGNYEIIAAFKVDLAEEKHFPYYDFIDGTEEEFNSYVKECKSRSFYDTGVEAQYGDRLLTLSTCEYTQKEGRMILVAKRINE